MLFSVCIIGCGDIGRRVATLYLARGIAVTALARSGLTAQALHALGIPAWQGDLDHPESLTNMPVADRVIFHFAPPPATGKDDPRMHAFLKGIKSGALPVKIIYISTSAVYGDCQGNWVDETASPHPRTDRGHRRLAAEQALQEWSRRTGVPAVILRVGGIYGPNRLPIARIKQGIPVLNPEECGYTNRIHADDLAQACVAAAERGRAGEIYNISDGHPGSMTDYFFRVADRFDLPHPPVITLAQARKQLSAEMLSYLEESRRLDNRKMLAELGVTLRYPTLVDGLAEMHI